MLYLAEVKAQNRGFVGGYKTELKLLASQEADQTWNSVSSSNHVVNVESINESASKGTLYILNLDSNQQSQAQPELAGNRIVNYLRYLSRALEKSKNLEIEIEEWKDSLKLQGEQIGKRQNELDQQQQIISQQQQNVAKLEQEKEQLNGAWEQLRSEQSRSNQAKNKLAELLQELNSNSSQPQNIADFLTIINRQQQLLNTYWQQLESEKNSLSSGENDLKTKQSQLEESRQQLDNLQNQLQSVLIKLTSNQNLVLEKEEALKQCSAQLEIIESLEQEVLMIADDDEDNVTDTNVLEGMPLGDLENIVNQLQQETSKLVNFVNLQEEELSLQSDEVKSIEQQINQSNAVEKFSLETELADAKEAMKLLNETLVGQRKTLKRQQKTLNKHLKILTRRKGVADIDFSQNINVKPLLTQITNQRQLAMEKKANLTSEIEQLNLLINQLEEQLPTLQQEYQEQKEQAQAKEKQLLQIYQQVTETECNLSLLEQLLEPIQEQVSIMTEKISTFQPQQDSNMTDLLNQLQSLL